MYICKKMESFILEDIDESRRIGYKDSNHQERIPPIYYVQVILPDGREIWNQDGEFQNGLAVVMNKEGRFGLIHADGSVVIPLQYDNISNVIVNDTLFFRKGSTCGFMKTNQLVIAEYPNCTYLQQKHDHVYRIEYNDGETQTELDLDAQIFKTNTT